MMIRGKQSLRAMHRLKDNYLIVAFSKINELKFSSAILPGTFYVFPTLTHRITYPAKIEVSHFFSWSLMSLSIVGKHEKKRSE